MEPYWMVPCWAYNGMTLLEAEKVLQLALIMIMASHRLGKSCELGLQLSHYYPIIPVGLERDWL